MRRQQRKTAGALDTLPTADIKENTEILDADSADSKSVAALIAGFTKAGHAVHRLSDGFLVCKFGLTRHCPTAHALAAFARVAGVRP